MSVTTPTAPTFTAIVTAASFASSATPGTTYQLDLTTKIGAWLYTRFGRNTGTALTRAAWIKVRRTNNNATNIPSTNNDVPSTTVACNQTTVASGGAAAALTMVLAAGTGFAAEQTCCAQLAGARIEFFSITDLTTATITIDRSTGFYVTHNASDVVTNGADVVVTWISGGEKWEITPVNNSGQTMIIGVDADIYASDTTV